jgi:hypothetical protein
VIVRIASEGQYEVPDDQTERLNELDNAAVAAVEAGNEDEFTAIWSQLLEFVKSSGRPIDHDELVGSDVILPPPDISFEEASAEFTGEGLIPD